MFNVTKVQLTRSQPDITVTHPDHAGLTQVAAGTELSLAPFDVVTTFIRFSNIKVQDSYLHT